LDSRTRHRPPCLRMAGPPSRRLARASTRLAADPLRSEGACSRPLPRLSSSETPAKDYNRKLRSLLHTAACAANLQRRLLQGLQCTAAKASSTRSGFECFGYHANMANFRSLHLPAQRDLAKAVERRFRAFRQCRQRSRRAAARGPASKSIKLHGCTLRPEEGRGCHRNLASRP
jgi:hypothetical protein